MSNKIQVAYISSPSNEGKELYKMISMELSKLGYGITHINEYGDNLAQRQWLGMCSCLMSDIVIFDGSLDKDDNDKNYSQYEYAISNMTSLDYVLIVSRTQLPYNELNLSLIEDSKLRMKEYYKKQEKFRNIKLDY